MRKNILLILLVALCVFIVGCKDSNIDANGSTPSSETATDKINLDDSVVKIKDKLYKACFFDKNNSTVKTMAQSLEYIKSVLPEGVKEIENVSSKEDGVTKLKYKIEDIVFYVVILHPHNGDSTENLKSVSGVTFPRVEIDIDWQSQ